MALRTGTGKGPAHLNRKTQGTGTPAPAAFSYPILTQGF